MSEALAELAADRWVVAGVGWVGTELGLGLGLGLEPERDDAGLGTSTASYPRH